jgi:hypothetical protein
MEDEVEDDPGGFWRHRDSMSRAATLAQSVTSMLKAEKWQGVSGSHSGLRIYALELCGLIDRMVDSSMVADAEEFDVICSVVASAAQELKMVINELL